MLNFRRVLAMPSNPLDCSHDPSRTRQEFAADADINNIVRRFLRDGVLPQPNATRPTITDGLSVPGDFQEACEAALGFQHEKQLVGNSEQLHKESEDSANGSSEQLSSSASEEAEKE